jgi:Transposase and inactivated derivatives
VRNISVLAAIGVDQQGYRSILGVAEGAKEDKAGWSGFLCYLKERGLTGIRLIIDNVFYFSLLIVGGGFRLVK